MFFKLYLIALVVFLIVDAIWLSTIANKFYSQHLGYIMKAKPNYIAAAIFYLLFIVGLVYFVILPGVNDGNIWKVILSGFLFGFMTYATYDLTNLATIKDWPLIVTIVDLIWGSSLAIVVSVATYYIYNALS